MASPTILPFKLVPTKGTILYAMCRVRTYYTDAVYGDASCVICHYRYMCATMCILSWAWVLRRIRSATVASLLCISCHFMFWWQVAHVLQLYISVCWSRGFSLNCAYFAKYAHTCACVCLCVWAAWPDVIFAPSSTCAVGKGPLWILVPTFHNGGRGDWSPPCTCKFLIWHPAKPRTGQLFIHIRNCCLCMATG